MTACHRSIIVAILLGSACRQAPPPDPPTRIVIATGEAEGVFRSVGKALSRAYGARIPNLRVELRLSAASLTNSDELQRGTADLGFEGSKTAYLAYSQGTQANPHPHLRIRAIAVLFPTAVHAVARRNTGIRSLQGLRNRRVGVAVPGSASEEASRDIMDSYGLATHYDRVMFASSRELVEAIRNGDVDGAFFYFPLQHSQLTELIGSGLVNLIPVDRERIGAIQDRSPFLKTTWIPAQTYDGQTKDVLTVGTDTLLLCREDLSDQLVRDLTRTLFEAVPELGQAHPAARAIDPDKGPTASIPLHAGAAAYYRERELAP